MSTKIKFLWTVIYLRYVFHVVTAGMLSKSSKKHSWKKMNHGYYNETIQIHATTVVLLSMCGNKGTLQFEVNCISTSINHSEWQCGATLQPVTMFTGAT